MYLNVILVIPLKMTTSLEGLSIFFTINIKFKGREIICKDHNFCSYCSHLTIILIGFDERYKFEHMALAIESLTIIGDSYLVENKAFRLYQSNM